MSYKYRYNHSLIKFAQLNRKKYTDAEKLIWYKLRNKQLKGYKFRRQYPVLDYILDFFCAEKNIAVELDGSQHMLNEFYDKKREIQLQKIGIKTLRFWDNDILLHIDSVLEVILTELEKDTIKKPHPTLS